VQCTYTNAAFPTNSNPGEMTDLANKGMNIQLDEVNQSMATAPAIPATMARLPARPSRLAAPV
jgi:hypothetical protein